VEAEWDAVTRNSLSFEKGKPDRKAGTQSHWSKERFRSMTERLPRAGRWAAGNLSPVARLLPFVVHMAFSPRESTSIPLSSHPFEQALRACPQETE
jgi:hypothetical protein